MEKKPLKTHRLKFTILEFFDDFVVSTLFENIIFDQKCVDILRDICLEFYKDESFVYISQRNVDYNVDPTIYRSLTNIRPLIGVAVVSHNISAMKMANFEKKFSPLPYEIFFEMEDAMEWAEELIRNKKADL